MSADLEQFYEVFFEESLELLVEMEVCLLGLDVSSPDLDALNAIFRAAHSIKGGAGTFGFTGMTELTHMLETLLDRLRKGELEVKSEMVDSFLKAGDVIKDQLAGHRGDGVDLDPEAIGAICKELKAFEEGDVAEGTEDSSASVTPEAADAAEAAPDVETEVEVDTGAAKSGEDYGFFAGAPAAPKESDAAENPKEAGTVAVGSGETSIRVSVKKMDQMINLVGELVITR
ncbi:MAG: Hpt domain-containing protein, partial [Gammaproteobacteria bacterium]|nr:Hpt domain-containing protein [Gammaproteobacteria bacterium]